MPQYILIAKETSPKKFEDYRIIEDSPTIPDGFTKLLGPASLDDCVRELNRISDNADKWFGLTKWQYILIGIVTIIFVSVVVFGAYSLPNFGKEKDAAGKFIYNQDDSARILITFLVAVATIAIAFMATLTAMVIREYKERFALAKEVLTILVGILGTIVGFYFGTANNPASNPNANTGATPTPSVSPTPPTTNTNTNVNTNTNANKANTAVIFRAPLEKGKYVSAVYDSDKNQLFISN